jgi:Skp family chaperone for outer membrane proteins
MLASLIVTSALPQTVGTKSPPLKIALISGYRSAYPSSEDRERFLLFATNYVKKHGYSMLLDAGSSDDTAPYLLFASKSIDISREVTEAFTAGLTGTVGSSPAKSAPATGARIATVEFQKAVSETAEFKTLLGDLRTKYEPQSNQLTVQTEEINRLKNQTQAVELSAAERQSLQTTIDAKEAERKRLAQASHDAFMAELGKLYDGVASRFWDAVSTYALKTGYTIVLDKSAKPHGILWCAEGFGGSALGANASDITSEITRFFDSR